jgi:hypothetical protein
VRLAWFAGTSVVKTSVLKDGHVFCVHVLDPKLPGQEEEEDEDDEEEKDKDKETVMDSKIEDEGQEKGEMEKQEKDGE